MRARQDRTVAAWNAAAGLEWRRARARSTNAARRSSFVLMGCLMLTGCQVNDGGVGGGSSTEAGTSSTAGGDGTTAGVDASTSPSSSMSESGMMVDPCADPQVIPPPPVDCSGADGVLTETVILDAVGGDPSILEGVVRVEGAIRIGGTALTNLDFMACVQEVTGDVTIFDNDQLTSLDGLWSLTEVGGGIAFSQNDAVEVFDGLPNMVRLVSGLVVRENASLQRLDGFHRLERIEGSVSITENPLLERIDGLIGWTSYAGEVALGSNPLLCESSVAAVFACIVEPAEPPPSWCQLAPCYAGC